MKRILTALLCLGLVWSLLTLLNMSGRQAETQQTVNNLQKKYSALQTLYDQVKEDKAASDAAWAEKSALWEKKDRELEELRASSASAACDNLDLIRENEALRRQAAQLTVAQEQAMREWTQRLERETAQREAAEKRLSDILAVLLPEQAQP